jgi:hypothetical protein
LDAAPVGSVEYPRGFERLRRERVLASELDQGGLGIGMGIAYTPGASAVEILRNFELCTERKVICFTHIRGAGGGLGGFGGLQEVLPDKRTFANGH